jgi:hypothetical protein
MKKRILIVTFLMITLLLVGCVQQTTTPTTTTTSTEETTTTTTVETTTTTEPISYTVVNVPFVNYSTEFVSETAGIAIDFYYYADKLNLPYVDISEFITLLDGLLDPTITVEVDDPTTVRVYIYYEYTEEEMEEYGLDDPIFYQYATFDFDDKTVTAPNAESFDYFSGETTTDFSEGLNLISSSEEELPAFSADVSAYGFDFRILDLETDKYLIPLSMANLFLTGSMYDVANNGNYLYGFDTYQFYDISDSTGDTDLTNDGLYNIVKSNRDHNDTVKTETINFLAFVFDYFYGLKDYKGVDNMTEYAWSYFPNLNNSTFMGNIYNFVESFEDEHTSVVDTGHNFKPYPSYTWDTLPPYLLETYNEYYGCGCDLLTEDFGLEISGTTAYLNLTSFSTDFKSVIEGYMAQINAAEPAITDIIIDMRCNGGGVIAGVFHLLNYMTNEDISLYSSTLGAEMSYTYDVEGDLAIDADFYILTSGYTYSAANLFTAAATEMGLAKTIGTRSGGGACSIQAVVLPNGTLVVMSSNMNLTDSQFVTVEEGIAPDYLIEWQELTTLPDLADLIAVINEMENPA